MTRLTEPRLIQPLTAEAFEVQWDETHKFPFFEDEHADGLWGYGHHDKQAFVDSANAFDQLCSLSELQEDEQYQASDATHLYGQAYTYTPEGEPEEWFIVTEDVLADSKNAFPITVISR